MSVGVMKVVVRLFIGTQNRLVALHSALIKAHEEADISPRSVIYRPVGSIKTKGEGSIRLVYIGLRIMCA
jgi:hypothetical protein